MIIKELGLSGLFFITGLYMYFKTYWYDKFLFMFLLIWDFNVIIGMMFSDVGS